ncbi:hypothetical protein FPOAC2_07524 [Fusarium poae]|jgi:hypothetical protein
MKSDDLVAEDVASSGQGLRDSSSPGVVVLDEIRSSPSSIKTSSINLDPLQSSRVSLGALSSTLGNICEDRTDVRFGPGRPLELDGTAGFDGHRAVAGSSLDVAGNVRGTEISRGNEAVVEVFGGPSSDVGNFLAVLGGVVRVDTVTRLVDTVDLDAGDSAVGEDGGGESTRNGCDGLERHDVVGLEVSV